MLSVDEKSQIQALDRTQPGLHEEGPRWYEDLRLQTSRHHDPVRRPRRSRRQGDRPVHEAPSPSGVHLFPQCHRRQSAPQQDRPRRLPRPGSTPCSQASPQARVFRSVKELKDAIHGFIADTNAKPRPDRRRCQTRAPSVRFNSLDWLQRHSLLAKPHAASFSVVSKSRAERGESSVTRDLLEPSAIQRMVSRRVQSTPIGCPKTSTERAQRWSRQTAVKPPYRLTRGVLTQRLQVKNQTAGTLTAPPSVSTGRGISPVLGLQNSPLWRGGDQPLA